MCTHSVLFLAAGKKGVWRQVTTEQQRRKAKQNQRCRGGAPSHGHALRQWRPWYANRAPKSGLWRRRRRRRREQVCKTRLVSCAKDRRNEKERKKSKEEDERLFIGFCRRRRSWVLLQILSRQSYYSHYCEAHTEAIGLKRSHSPSSFLGQVGWR